MTTAISILDTKEVKVTLHYFDEKKEDVNRTFSIDEKGMWVNLYETIDGEDIKRSITSEYLGTADEISIYNAENNRLIAHFIDGTHLLSIYFFERQYYKTLAVSETDLVNV